MKAIRYKENRFSNELEDQRQSAGTAAPRPRSRAVSELRLFTMPSGGTDRLNFRTWDTIAVLRPNEAPLIDTVELRGYYLIERAEPTSSSWHDASIDIFMREMSVSGVSKVFGRIQAGVNHDIGMPSRGQVRPGTIYDSPADSPKLCEMFGYMEFNLADLGVSAFNKEAIKLTHSITHVPPIGQGGGTADGIEIPLYLKNRPDDAPVAILRKVKTHIGAWLDE